MKQIYYIGVDISKEKIDIAVISDDYKILQDKTVENQDAKIVGFFNQLMKKLKIEKSQLLVCCEETGIYKRPLQRACLEQGIDLWVQTAIKIKRAASDLRGKSDRQDARRIAEYACRYEDKKVIYKEADASKKSLQVLLNARDTLTAQLVAINQQLNESKRFDKEKYDIQYKCFKSSLTTIKKQLIEIEKKMDQIVNDCPEMARNFKLLTTIPGIGRQTALQFIMYTHNFTAFNNAKHLACYAGVAPFLDESGKIIKKAKVSHLANKKLKTLLHLASMACIKAKGELKEYYIRKVKEGKCKMVVLNNLRNKLIQRMFAVIKRQTEYISIKNEINTCILT